MIVRVKDFLGAIDAIRDHESLFGDPLGDDRLALAFADETTLDPENKRFRFVASDDTVDLHDEIIAEGAFHEFRDVYLRNPAILASHQHRLPNGLSAIVGKTVQLQTEVNPVWGIGQLVNTAAGRDHAEAVFSGAQRGVSVGFRSRDTDRRDGRVVHTKALLLEISLVPVPANPNALVLAYVHGQLERHGQTITDPAQAEDVAAMLRELRADLDRLKSATGPNDRSVTRGASCAGAAVYHVRNQQQAEDWTQELHQVRDMLTAAIANPDQRNAIADVARRIEAMRDRLPVRAGEWAGGLSTLHSDLLEALTAHEKDRLVRDFLQSYEDDERETTERPEQALERDRQLAEHAEREIEECLAPDDDDDVDYERLYAENLAAERRAADQREKLFCELYESLAIAKAQCALSDAGGTARNADGPKRAAANLTKAMTDAVEAVRRAEEQIEPRRSVSPGNNG